MASRGPALAPVRRSPSRERLVLGPASEPTMRSCEIAWLERSRSAQEGHLLRLQKHKSRALRSARRLPSSEEPGPRPEAEIGTIAHSFANVWRARFADSWSFGLWPCRAIPSVGWPLSRNASDVEFL